MSIKEYKEFLNNVLKEINKFDHLCGITGEDYTIDDFINYINNQLIVLNNQSSK